MMDMRFMRYLILIRQTYIKAADPDGGKNVILKGYYDKPSSCF